MDFRRAASGGNRGGSGESAGAGASYYGQEDDFETHGDAYHGLTDAYKEVKGIEMPRVKLPRSYAPNCEKLPEWVEKDNGPLPPEEIDDTDWSDGPSAATGRADEDKFKPLPKVLAGANCNYYIQPGVDKMARCPYDSSHEVLESRLMRHLTKCRSNYVKQRKTAGKPIEIEQCTFNTTHHIFKNCMAEHYKVCPQALDAAREKEKHDELHKKEQEQKNGNSLGNQKAYNSFSDTASRSSFTDTTPDKKDFGHILNTDENWELQRPVAAYDPATKLQNPGLFYNPQGLTKSERKGFRETQRLRYLEQQKLQQDKEERQKNDDFREDFPKVEEWIEMPADEQEEGGEGSDEEGDDDDDNVYAEK